MGHEPVQGIIILNTGTVRAAIFVEATSETNAVDNNVIWDCCISRNPECYPRETGGFGVLTTESQNLIVAHNLIGACRGAGVTLGLGDPNRNVRGQPPVSRGHVVHGNVFWDCATPVVLPNATNECDHNLYGKLGTKAVWRMEQPEWNGGLKAWQEEKGFDLHARLADFEVTVEPRSGELRISAPPHVPSVPRLPFLTHDLRGTARNGVLSAAGPFAQPVSGSIRLWEGVASEKNP